MSKRCFFSFLLRGEPDLVVFEVAEDEHERLANSLSTEEEHKVTGFFGFDTVDGRTVHVSKPDIQAVRLLWDPALSPYVITPYEGSTQLRFKGRPGVLEDDTEPDDAEGLIGDLCINRAPFVSFIDGDGEPLIFARSELLWVITRTARCQAENSEDDDYRD